MSLLPKNVVITDIAHSSDSGSTVFMRCIHCNRVEIVRSEISERPTGADAFVFSTACGCRFRDILFVFKPRDMELRPAGWEIPAGAIFSADRSQHTVVDINCAVAVVVDEYKPGERGDQV